MAGQANLFIALLIAIFIARPPALLWPISRLVFIAIRLQPASIRAVSHDANGR
jgi:hypothetical protein